MGKPFSRLKGARSRSRYLRKNRKWPSSAYKTSCHDCFSQKQPLQTNNNTILNKLAHSLYCKLIKSHSFNQIPQLLNHLQSFKHLEAPDFVFPHLIKAYGKLRLLEEAVTLFYWIPKLGCFPTASSLNALLSVLCREKQGIKFVPHVLVQSHRMGIRFHESSFRILIAALCRIRKLAFAIHILRFVINFGYDVDFKICSLILSGLCQDRYIPSVDGVLSFFGEMRELGFFPERADYANLIRLLVKSGRGADALDMLERMKGDAIKPDIFCYTMVLDGMIKDEKFDKAETLFDELLLLGLVPDVYTYTVYIKGLCKQNRLDEGLKMVEYMGSLGCKPNSVTYNILLDGLCKVGDLEKAKMVFAEMGSRGVGLDLQTYKIMVKALIGEGQIVESCSFLHEMLDKNIKI